MKRGKSVGFSPLKPISNYDSSRKEETTSAIAARSGGMNIPNLRINIPAPLIAADNKQLHASSIAASASVGNRKKTATAPPAYATTLAQSSFTAHSGDSFGDSKDSLHSSEEELQQPAAVNINEVYRSRSESPTMFESPQISQRTSSTIPRNVVLDLYDDSIDESDLPPPPVPPPLLNEDGNSGNNDGFLLLTPRMSRQRNSTTTKSIAFSSRISTRSTIAAAGNERKVMRGHRKAIRSTAVLLGRETTLALTGDDSGDILVWSLLFGEQIATLKAHTARVSSIVVFSADDYEPLAISGSWDESIRIWPMDALLKLNAPVSSDNHNNSSSNNNNNNNNNNSYSNDYNNKRSSSSSMSSSMGSTRIDHCNVRVLSLATVYVEGGTALLAAGGCDSKIRLYALPSGELKLVLADTDDLSWTLCLRSHLIRDRDDPNNCGAVLVAGCRNNCVKIWKVPDGVLFPFSTGDDKKAQHSTTASAATAASRAGGLLVRLTSRALSRQPSQQQHQKQPHVLLQKQYSRMASRSQHQQQQQQRSSSTVAFTGATSLTTAAVHKQSTNQETTASAGVLSETSSTGSIAGFFSHRKKAKFADSQKNSQPWSSSGKQSFTAAVESSSSNRINTSGKRHSTIQQQLPQRSKSVFQRMRSIASTHEKHMPRETRYVQQRLQQQQKPMKVIHHPWGRVVSLVLYDCDEELFIATVCRDAEIRVWASSGELTKTLRVPSGCHLTAVTAFDATGGQGGAIIAAGSEEGDIRLWHHATGEMFRVFSGHADEVTKLSVFPSPFRTDRDLLKRSASVAAAAYTSSASTIATPAPSSSLSSAVPTAAANRDEISSSSRIDSAMLRAESSDTLNGSDHGATKKSNELVVLSCSVDCSLRSWMVDEEKSLKVLHHGDFVHVTAMDVYCGDETIVVTGADDGFLRGWLLTNSNVKHSHTMVWCTETHHGSHVQSLAIYCPNESYEAASAIQRGELPDYLDEPFVVSSAEDGRLLLSSLLDGELFGRIDSDSNSPVSSIRICSGLWPDLSSLQIHRRIGTIEPFIVTGSEDKTLRVYSLVNLKCIHTLRGHQFGITSVAIYLPQERYQQQQQQLLMQRQQQLGANELTAASSSFRMSAKRLPSTFSSKKIARYVSSGLHNCDPIIVSGSFDNTVRLWSYSMGKQLASLRGCNAHVTAVGTVQLLDQPAVVAGDVEGNFYIWSLHPPFRLQQKLQSHATEVEVLALHDVEGRFPVLVGGHLDGSNTVWNLQKNELITVLEGHRAQVTAVKVFAKGGSLSAVASASRDGTVRVVFDFLDAIPDAGKILSMFNSDKDASATTAGVPKGVEGGTGGEGEQQQRQSHYQYLGSSGSHFAGKCRWPRIAEAVKRVTAEEFFAIYFYLFKHALKVNRADFLVDFLPQTRAGLLNSHNTSLIGKNNDLLSIAIDMKSSTAVRTIVDCWISFLSTAPTSDQDLYYEVNFPELGATILLLGEHYPADFERLVCSMKPVRVRYNIVAPEKKFLYYHKPSRSMQVGVVSASGPEANEVFYFLPVPYFATGHVLMAFEAACEQLDSVDIFDSEAGKLILQYAWCTSGLKAHFYSMVFYFLFVAVMTVHLLTFHIWSKHRSTYGITLLLMVVELAFDVAYIYQEGLQFLNDMLWYLMHIWNAVDMVVFLGNMSAVIIRLVYWRDTLVSQVILSISIVAAYFNILQYLRAYEATGPLVSMILTIAHDIKYLVFVLALVLLGFTQAFWILTKGDEAVVFHDIDQSLLYSFSFMLGGYEPDAFEGATLEGFVTTLSVLYMLIVAILLLNLLIALMGNTYSNVQTKGLAQWRLELAKICIDMESSVFAQDNETIRAKQNDVIYIRTSSEVDDDCDVMLNSAHATASSNSSSSGRVSTEQLREGQSHLCNALAQLDEQVDERLQEQTKSLQKQIRKLERMLLEVVANTRSQTRHTDATAVATAGVDETKRNEGEDSVAADSSDIPGKKPAKKRHPRVSASSFDSPEEASSSRNSSSGSSKSSSSSDSGEDADFGYFQKGERSTVRLLLDAEKAANNH